MEKFDIHKPRQIELSYMELMTICNSLYLSYRDHCWPYEEDEQTADKLRLKIAKIAAELKKQ